MRSLTSSAGRLLMEGELCGGCVAKVNLQGVDGGLELLVALWRCC